MVHPSQQRPPYPRRQPSLSVTLAHRGRSRVIAIRPFVAASVLGALALFAVTVVGASAFLVFRDDLVGAAISRQVDMQYTYEERIAALRSELDRITSRHFVHTESVEEQLTTLLDRQALIEQRQTQLDTLVEKARASGIEIAVAETRLPRARPDDGDAATAPSADSVAPLAYMPAQKRADAAITGTLLGGDKLDRQQVLSHVQSSLDNAQDKQTEALGALSATVEGEVERLSSALKPIGIKVDDTEAASSDAPQGGPFIPATGPATELHFVERTALLGRMLDDIRSARRSAAALPVGKPLATLKVSSGFGYRTDPFLKRPAFHAGLDFAAPEGTLVRATAPGVVTMADWNEGYGLMVEIRHAGGVSTRYGHLSAKLVSEGDRVDAGTPIGRVGSTGRSTGPHLHYETRKDGKVVNPAIFFAARRALSPS